MELSEIPQTPIIRECNNRGCFWFCFVFFCNQIKKSAFQSLHDKFYSAWLMLVQCRLRAWPWQSLLTTSLEKVNYNEFVLWSLERRIGYRWETKVKKKRKASLKWHQGDNGARFHTTTTWIGIHWGLDDTFWIYVPIAQKVPSIHPQALDGSIALRISRKRCTVSWRNMMIWKMDALIRLRSFFFFFFMKDVWIGRNYFAAVSRHTAGYFENLW